MTREEQDKNWNELSIVVQGCVIERYKSYDTSDPVLKAFKASLEYTYGSHNLQSTLTYEDVALELFMEKRVYYFNWDEYDILESAIHCKSEDWYKAPLNCTSERQGQKLKAINKLLNVAKFLNKNEDGSDWVPDWSVGKEKKFYFREFNGCINIESTFNIHTSIVYFRTRELAEKAIQILGEETIQLALTTDY